MNIAYLCSISPLFLLLALNPSCSEPSQSKAFAKNMAEEGLTQKTSAQIAEYVVAIFEDRKGDLWFGTMSKGAARYDGKTLTYFTTNEGLNGNTVASFAQDKEGNLWLGTHSGLSKYDGQTFTNFTTKDGLCHDRVSNILIDRAGNMWIGTWGGVCQYNLPSGQAGGYTFSDFPIPLPDVDAPTNEATQNWVTEIMEDKEGNIWFGRDGYGACKYNPAKGEFTHFTNKNGLPSNNIQAIHEDRQGNIWFGSRVAERDNPDPSQRSGRGGLSRYDGNNFIQYPTLEGLSKNDIYTIYEDKAGNIWIGATGYGAYRYDGEKFTVFKETDRMDLTAGFGLQTAWEDRNGTLWFGFSGGLFRFNGTSIVNVTQDGPWN